MPRKATVTTIVLLLALAACGGSSSSSPTPTPTPTPTPASVTTLVSQGSTSNLQTFYVAWVPFTTVSTGRIDANVDWTFATDTVWLVVATGSHTCYDGQYINFSICNVIASLNDASKPKKLSLPGQPAGTYTLYVRNRGPNTEAISWQVFVTTPG